MLVFLSLPLMSCRSANGSLSSGFSSLDTGEDEESNISNKTTLQTSVPTVGRGEVCVCERLTTRLAGLTVLGPVPGRAAGAAAAVALLGFVLVLLGEGPVLGRPCGEDRGRGYISKLIERDMQIAKAAIFVAVTDWRSVRFRFILQFNS